MKTTVWWLSTKRMTVKVVVENGIIVDAAPVVRKFVNQRLENLERWMRKQGDLEKCCSDFKRKS